MAVICLTACQISEKKSVNIIPYPNELEIVNGTFQAAGADIHYNAGFEQYAKDAIAAFAGQLSLTSGVASKVSEGTEGSGFNFILSPDMPKEAYKLDIGRKKVRIEASSLNGVIYAIQTIRQMLPTEIFGKEEATGADWSIQCAKISDEPRFGYRGVLLDVGRHFFDVDQVKSFIDILEFHKINIFHWHLTEDQGWRIEIKKYPRLTQIGSIRKETLVGHLSNSKEYDGTPYGEGMWYTQDQIREIVAYAASKGITVIPEIDLPGHMVAALAAYPELGCTGGPYEVWGKWGISDDVLCVGKESTMEFLEDVLTEVCELFPSTYIHIGGDECPKVRWETCPHCQAKIKELGIKADDKHTAEQYLQSYVTARIENFLAEKGRKIIGWDEILEGELSQNATVMSWRGIKGGLEAVRTNRDAIMTPNSYCYLDYYQSGDKENEPYLCIGGNLPIEKCYSLEPTTDEMTEEEKSHFIGVQANLWTEYIGTTDHLYYMLLPRLAALSEVQWCQMENKDWDRFYDSADELCAIYKTMGYNYGPHIFAVKGEVITDHESNKVKVELSTQGEAAIRYTLDGSEPDSSSDIYTGPIDITGSCTVKARNDRSDAKTGTFSRTFVEHKAMGRKILANSEATEKYSYNYPDNLTDGVRGKEHFASGEWTGFKADHLDVIIEMDGLQKYNSVTVGSLISKKDHIFNPASITISLSKNDADYLTVAHQEYPAFGQNDPDGIKNYKFTFPESDSKYIRVVVKQVEAMPEWHNARGKKPYIFVDEIAVE